MVPLPPTPDETGRGAQPSMLMRLQQGVPVPLLGGRQREPRRGLGLSPLPATKVSGALCCQQRPAGRHMGRVHFYLPPSEIWRYSFPSSLGWCHGGLMENQGLQHCLVVARVDLSSCPSQCQWRARTARPSPPSRCEWSLSRASALPQPGRSKPAIKFSHIIPQTSRFHFKVICHRKRQEDLKLNVRKKKISKCQHQLDRDGGII